jgi:FSR family fosmidomycin resistance protein-like MFS transporter
MAKYLSRTVLLMALGHLTIELCNNFMPIVYPLFITKLDLSYTQVGLVVLVASMGSSLVQPVFGYLSDRWGSTRMTVLSVAWIGLVMGTVGFAHSYITLILLVGLGALGSSAFHPAGVTLASIGSTKRRGTAMSVFSVSGNLGTALSPLLVTAGLAWLGLPGTVVIMPFALLVSLLFYRQISLGHLVRASQKHQPSNEQRTGNQSRLEFGPIIGLVLIIMAVMCRSWFQTSLMTYLPEWLQSRGYSLAVGGQMLSVLMISVSVGSLSGGTLSDYIGRWQVFALSLGLLAPVYWLFLTGSGVWQFGWLIVIGVLVGASFPVGLVLAQETWPARIGLASALVMGVGWAPGGLGASVTGAIADQFSLTTGLQSLILAPLLGVGCTVAYVLMRRRGNLMEKWRIEAIEG